MSSIMVVLRIVGCCTYVWCFVVALRPGLLWYPYEFPRLVLACMLLLFLLFLDAKMGWDFCDGIIVCILSVVC
jgi:hypothetical protein